VIHKKRNAKDRTVLSSVESTMNLSNVKQSGLSSIQSKTRLLSWLLILTNRDFS